MKQLNKNISVIIPTYQPKAYLKKCFDSLEAQTLSKDRFCVYIALNGDKYPYEDDVLSLLEKYNFKSKYIYIEQVGVSNARNKLLACSSEGFIAFIDDDDRISNDYLSNLLDISTQENVGISKVYNFKENINITTSNYIGKLYDKLSLVEKSKFKARKYYSPICAKLIHRSIIAKAIFDTNLANGEDSLFMATISKNIKYLCKPSNEACYYIYERQNSASRRKISLSKRIRNYTYLIAAYLKLLISPKYDKLFILTRIAATFKKLVLGIN